MPTVKKNTAEDRRVISILVDNQRGVLARVSSLFNRRGFNIDSLTVSTTNDPTISRITVTTHGDENAISQLLLQTDRLEVTRQVFELDPDNSLQRELLLLIRCLCLRSREDPKGLTDGEAQVLKRAEQIIDQEAP